MVTIVTIVRHHPAGTKVTIETISHLADSGADTALVYTPCFYRGGMTHEAFLQHFTKVNNTPSPSMTLSALSSQIKQFTKIRSEPKIKQIQIKKVIQF